MSHISGAYSATLGGTSIGSTEEGFRLIGRQHWEPILSDDFGEAPVDGVQRGVTYTIQFMAQEYSLIKAAYARQLSALGESKTHVGKLLSGLAQTLVMTAVAGTPAAGAGLIATLTATKAICVSDIELLLSSKLRKGPVTFHLFPDPEVSNKAWVST